MTQTEHEIVQEEKAIALMKGVVIGATSVSVLILIIYFLTQLGL